jgi:heavy metal sensor kinase
MAAVLAGTGAFLYFRLGDSLEEQLADNLELRAGALATLLSQGQGSPGGRDLAFGDDEVFAQVLTPEGALLASSPLVAGTALLSRAERAKAAEGSFFLDRRALRALDGEAAKLLVTEVDTPDRSLVLVVGSSLEDREEALGGLLTQLAIVGPIALVLTSAAGYLLAGAALAPVEAMRRKAAGISSVHPGQRLPLARARDEIRRLGETLNAMLERLEAGLERERRFVADAGHELRTPLALLSTELELALRRPRPGQELEQALRSAAEEVDRLCRLTEGLLVLAQADEGRLPLRPAPLSAGALLEAVAARFAQRAAAEGRPLEVRVDGEVTISGDRLRLEQAIGNVVENALRHGERTVRLDAVARDAVVDIRVADEGAGFPPEFLRSAFERFSRGDAARAGGGAGLGLAIVASIVRAHGGAVTACNREGGGAVVTLTVAASSTEPRKPGGQEETAVRA